MCRRYGKGENAYVRLCYRCGDRRGEHMPLDEAIAHGWRPGGHVRLGSRRRENKKYYVPSRPLEREVVCTRCRRPFIGRDEWCPECQEWDRRRRLPLQKRLELEFLERMYKQMRCSGGRESGKTDRPPDSDK